MGIARISRSQRIYVTQGAISLGIKGLEVRPGDNWFCSALFISLVENINVSKIRIRDLFGGESFRLKVLCCRDHQFGFEPQIQQG